MGAVGLVSGQTNRYFQCMEILGLFIVFAALASILIRMSPGNSAAKNTIKPLSSEEERALAAKRTAGAKKKSDLVIYWTDTSAPLTYADLKALEQRARVASLTPNEVILVDPVSSRKITVHRMGDPTTPRLR